MSDRVADDELPTLEQRMDDVRAVMDAAGSERAALFGHSEGGNMCVLFAATYPERTVALCTFGSTQARIWSARLPVGADAEARAGEIAEVERTWGPGSTRPRSRRASTRRGWRRSAPTCAARPARAPVSRC